MDIQQLLRLSKMEMIVPSVSIDCEPIFIKEVKSLSVLEVSLCVRQYNKYQLNAIKQTIDNKLKIAYKEVSNKTGLPYDEVQSDYTEYCRLNEEENKYIDWENTPKTFEEYRNAQQEHENKLRDLKKADYDLQMANNDNEKKIALQFLVKVMSENIEPTHTEQEKIWEKQSLIFKKYEHIKHINRLDNHFQIINNYELIKTEIEKCFQKNPKEQRPQTLNAIIKHDKSEEIVELIYRKLKGNQGRELRVLYDLLKSESLINIGVKPFHEICKIELKWYRTGLSNMANFSMFEYTDNHKLLFDNLKNELEKLEIH